MNLNIRKISQQVEFWPFILYELIKENKIEAEAIVFIPSSKRALKDRGFNQCEFLAKEISRRSDIKIYKDIIKAKNIKEQKTLSKEDRIKNVKDAFKIKDKNNIKGKKIILLDDVITTGATLFECEKILKAWSNFNKYIDSC